MSAPGFTMLARRAAPVVGLAALAASVVVGGDLFGTRASLFGTATPGPKPAAVSRSPAFRPVKPAAAPVSTSVRSSPWWQVVRRASGDGPQALPAVAVSTDAIQVRVRWTCRRGRFRLRGAGAVSLVDAPCAGTTTTVLRPGVGRDLRVEADGPWTARLEQQVDVALVEPPTAAMRAATAAVVAGGRLYRLDEVGEGRLTAYRIGPERYALRLEDFFVTPNANLELRLSPLARPRSTREFQRAPSRFAGRLDVTTGSVNVTLPPGVDPRRYRSVVVWCAEVQSAYAAAALERRR